MSAIYLGAGYDAVPLIIIFMIMLNAVKAASSQGWSILLAGRNRFLHKDTDTDSHKQWGEVDDRYHKFEAMVK